MEQAISVEKDQKLKTQLEEKIENLKVLIDKTKNRFNNNLLRERLRSYEGILRDIKEREE